MAFRIAPSKHRFFSFVPASRARVEGALDRR